MLNLFNTELNSQQHYNSCLNKVYLTNMCFLHKAHPSLVVLRSTREHFSALYLGGSLKQWKITNKKHKNAKKLALNRPQKGYLFTVWELKQEARVVSTSTGNAHVCQATQIFTALHVSEWSQKSESVSIDLGLGYK